MPLAAPGKRWYNSRMIQLDDKSLDMIYDILRSTPLSRKYNFVIFGSRARGDARKFSDIDIGIVGDEPASLADMGLLNEQFENSSLVYKVEVVDFQRTSGVFRRLANKEAQRLEV